MDHYGTQAAIAANLPISLKTIGTALREPGYGAEVSDRLRVIARNAVEEIDPFPLPLHFNLTRKSFSLLKKRPGSPELRDRINEIEGTLSAASYTSAFDNAGKCYLLALTAISRGLHHGTNATWFGGKRLEAIQDAQSWCLEGRKYVEAPAADLTDEELINRKKLDYALFSNWLIAVASESKFKSGRSKEVTHGILKDADVVGVLKRFLEENKFLWQAAANGLELTSTLGSPDEDMLYFYDRLTALDPGFTSFDYSPGEVPAISNEPGMKRFHDKFRASLHKPLVPATPKKTKKAKRAKPRER
jgi:hypothetical protein